MKNLWIIANWKSNKNLQEALEWLGEVGPKIERREDIKVVVCPTFSALEEVAKAIKVGNFPLMMGSQNLSPFDEGAYTGEEAASILKQFVQISILGHSERRYNFGETDEMVAKKAERANEVDIIPLVCVQGNETPVPKGCNMIAYEPTSAISTGLTNTPGVGKADNPHDANAVAEFFKDQYGEELQVIYGGSVNSTNVKEFVKEKSISGVLVGNASLDPEEFVKIVQESSLV